MTKKGHSIPVRVVDLGLGSEQFLLTGLVGIVATDLVTVFFGLKEGEQVEAAPDFLTGEFTRTKEYQRICNWAWDVSSSKAGQFILSEGVTYFCSRIP